MSSPLDRMEDQDDKSGTDRPKRPVDQTFADTSVNIPTEPFIRAIKDRYELKSDVSYIAGGRHSNFPTNIWGDWDIKAKDAASPTRKSPIEIKLEEPAKHDTLDSEATEFLQSADETQSGLDVEVPQKSNLVSGLPQINRNFCGRVKILEKLDYYFNSAQLIGKTIIVLHGSAGIGKTAILTELCHRLIEKPTFHGNIFWIDGYSSLSFMQSLSSHHRALFPDVDSSSLNQISKAMAVAEWLIYSTSHNIVIIDDMRRESIDTLVGRFVFGATGSSSLLITSRDSQLFDRLKTKIRRRIQLFFDFEVMPFSKEECKEFTRICNGGRIDISGIHNTVDSFFFEYSFNEPLALEFLYKSRIPLTAKAFSQYYTLQRRFRDADDTKGQLQPQGPIETIEQELESPEVIWNLFLKGLSGHARGILHSLPLVGQYDKGIPLEILVSDDTHITTYQTIKQELSPVLGLGTNKDGESLVYVSPIVGRYIPSTVDRAYCEALAKQILKISEDYRSAASHAIMAETLLELQEPEDDGVVMKALKLWLAGYKQWFGDLEGAEVLFTSISYQRSDFERTSEQMDWSSFCLSSLYQDAGEFIAAASGMQKVALRQENSHVLMKPKISHEIKNLHATSLISLGRYKDALKYLDDSNTQWRYWPSSSYERLGWYHRRHQKAICFWKGFDRDINQAKLILESLLCDIIRDIDEGEDSIVYGIRQFQGELLCQTYNTCCDIQFDEGKYDAALANALRLSHLFKDQNFLLLQYAAGDMLLRLQRFPDAIDQLKWTLAEYRDIGYSYSVTARQCQLSLAKALLCRGGGDARRVVAHFFLSSTYRRSQFSPLLDSLEPRVQRGNSINSMYRRTINEDQKLVYGGDRQGVLIVHALILEDSGHLKEAVDIYESILNVLGMLMMQKRDPEHLRHFSSVVGSLGRLYARRTEYERAITLLQPLYTALTSSNPTIYTYVECMSIVRYICTLIVSGNIEPKKLEGEGLKIEHLAKILSDFIISDDHGSQDFLPERGLCEILFARLRRTMTTSTLDMDIDLNSSLRKITTRLYPSHPDVVDMYINFSDILLEEFPSNPIKRHFLRAVDSCEKRYSSRHAHGHGLLCLKLLMGHVEIRSGEVERACETRDKVFQDLIAGSGCLWSHSRVIEEYLRLDTMIINAQPDHSLSINPQLDSEKKFSDLLRKISVDCNDYVTSISKDSPLSLLIIDDFNVDLADDLRTQIGPLILSQLLHDRLEAVHEAAKSLLTLIDTAHGISCVPFWDFVNQNWKLKNNHLLDRILMDSHPYDEGRRKINITDDFHKVLKESDISQLSTIKGIIWAFSIIWVSSRGLNMDYELLSPRFELTECFGGHWHFQRGKGWDGFQSLISNRQKRVSFLKVDFDTTPYTPKEKYNCWTKMFGKARISDLSILKVPHEGKGLKLSFELLIQLSGVQREINHEGGIILIGYQTALIPMKELGDSSILWHLVVVEEQISRYIADDKKYENRLRTTDLNRLKGTAYLGWCEKVVHALGVDPNLPKARMTKGLKSIRKSYRFSQLILQGGLTSGLPPVSGGLQIQTVFQQNNIVVKFAAQQDFEASINQSWNSKIIVYDEAVKTAWLVSTLHLILYSMRCYLEREVYTRELQIDRTKSIDKDGMRESIYAEKERWDKEIATNSTTGPSFEELFTTLRIALGDAVYLTRNSHESDKFIGVELVDIIKGSDDAFAKAFGRKEKSVAAWSYIGNNRGFIVCSGIGQALEIVAPAQIPACAKIPPDLNVLACTVKDLESITDSECNRNAEEVCAKDNWSWNRVGNFFTECKESSCTGGCWATKLQRLSDSKQFFSKKPLKLKLPSISRTPATPPPDALLDIPETAGVCFGQY